MFSGSEASCHSDGAAVRQQRRSVLRVSHRRLPITSAGAFRATGRPVRRAESSIGTNPGSPADLVPVIADFKTRRRVRVHLARRATLSLETFSSLVECRYCLQVWGQGADRVREETGGALAAQPTQANAPDDAERGGSARAFS